MPSFSHGNRMMKFILVWVLFSSSISAGLCATLCNARICCALDPPKATVAKVAIASHDCCESKTLVSNAHLASSKTSPKCCKWITERRTSPIVAKKNPLNLGLEAPEAVLPCRIVLVESERLLPVRDCIVHHDSLPPGPPGSVSQARAPPIV